MVGFSDAVDRRAEEFRTWFRKHHYGALVAISNAVPGIQQRSIEDQARLVRIVLKTLVFAAGIVSMGFDVASSMLFERFDEWRRLIRRIAPQLVEELFKELPKRTEDLDFSQNFVSNLEDNHMPLVTEWNRAHALLILNIDDLSGPIRERLQRETDRFAENRKKIVDGILERLDHEIADESYQPVVFYMPMLSWRRIWALALLRIAGFSDYLAARMEEHRAEIVAAVGKQRQNRSPVLADYFVAFDCDLSAWPADRSPFRNIFAPDIGEWGDVELEHEDFPILTYAQ
jgi:hypothetical protein